MNNLTDNPHQSLKLFYRNSIILFMILLVFCITLYLCIKDSSSVTSIVQLLYPEKNIEQLQLSEYALTNERLLSEKMTLFTKVFFHNSLVCAIVIIAAYVPFCFFAQWAMLINCTLNVLVLTVLSNKLGNDSSQFWINNVLIHGIPELLAFSIVYALGFHICYDMTRLCLKNLKFESLGYLSHPKTALKIYCYLVLPIILMASLIEGFA